MAVPAPKLGQPAPTPPTPPTPKPSTPRRTPTPRGQPRTPPPPAAHPSPRHRPPAPAPPRAPSPPVSRAHQPPPRLPSLRAGRALHAVGHELPPDSAAAILSLLLPEVAGAPGARGATWRTRGTFDATHDAHAGAAGDIRAGVIAGVGACVVRASGGIKHSVGGHELRRWWTRTPDYGDPRWGAWVPCT